MCILALSHYEIDPSNPQQVKSRCGFLRLVCMVLISTQICEEDKKEQLLYLGYWLTYLLFCMQVLLVVICTVSLNQLKQQKL